MTDAFGRAPPSDEPARRSSEDLRRFLHDVGYALLSEAIGQAPLWLERRRDGAAGGARAPGSAYSEIHA